MTESLMIAMCELFGPIVAPSWFAWAGCGFLLNPAGPLPQLKRVKHAGALPGVSVLTF